MTNEIDKSNLRNTLLNFPEQFKKALEFAKDKKVEGNFNKVIVCGLGGSAMPGDIIDAYLKSKNINLPVEVCRGYNLPISADSNTLVFISSYSGNTEETLSCFDEALKKGLKIIGFARSESKLEKRCKENSIPFVEYPDDGPDFQPRCALGYSFTAMLLVLESQGLVSGVTDEINDLIEFLKPDEVEEEGKKLAGSIGGAIALIYSSDKYERAVSRICKIKINENSKTQSFFNAFPELNHNEMIGFTRLIGKYHIVIFKDPKDHERVMKRFDIMSKMLKEKDIAVTTIEMKGNSVLKKIFSSLLLFDWVSYYIAIEAEQDPTPVIMVEDFKKKMAE